MNAKRRPPRMRGAASRSAQDTKVTLTRLRRREEDLRYLLTTWPPVTPAEFRELLNLLCRNGSGRVPR
jgi:hypothetical protein